MKILAIGDIYAKLGRKTITKVLPDLRKEFDIDLVIANCENLTHGSGFIEKHIKEMQDAGVDFFTTGNHAFGRESSVNILEKQGSPVIRPANFPCPEQTPGKGYSILQLKNGKKVLIVNLLGQAFIRQDVTSPISVINQILEETKGEDIDATIIDFHAEATAEKYALAFYLDGRVSGIFGTHTHVPTADERVLPKGTAFICDVGMSGAYNSVIGLDLDMAIDNYRTQIARKHEPQETGDTVFNGVLMDIDEKTKLATNIMHIQKVFKA